MITLIRTHAGSFFGSLCEILVGILLLTNPVRFTSGIIIAVGVLLAVLGVYHVVRYVRAEPLIAAHDFSLAKGLVLLAAGLFCMFGTEFFIATFPALTMLYGAVLLLLGFIRVQRAVDQLRLRQETWFFSALAAAATLIIAVLILVNPFHSVQILWTLLGITLLADAICDLLCLFFMRRSSI